MRMQSLAIVYSENRSHNALYEHTAIFIAFTYFDLSHTNTEHQCLNRSNYRSDFAAIDLRDQLNSWSSQLYLFSPWQIPMPRMKTNKQQSNPDIKYRLGTIIAHETIFTSTVCSN